MINTYLDITLNINCNVFPKPHEYYGEFITNLTSYHDTIMQLFIFLVYITYHRATTRGVAKDQFDAPIVLIGLWWRKEEATSQATFYVICSLFH